MGRALGTVSSPGRLTDPAQRADFRNSNFLPHRGQTGVGHMTVIIANHRRAAKVASARRTGRFPNASHSAGRWRLRP